MRAFDMERWVQNRSSWLSVLQPDTYSRFKCWAVRTTNWLSCDGTLSAVASSGSFGSLYQGHCQVDVPFPPLSIWFITYKLCADGCTSQASLYWTYSSVWIQQTELYVVLKIIFWFIVCLSSLIFISVMVLQVFAPQRAKMRSFYFTLDVFRILILNILSIILVDSPVFLLGEKNVSQLCTFASILH